MKLPVRQPVARGSVRRRRSAPSWIARTFGVFLAVLAGASMYWLTRAATFDVEPTRVHVSGLVYTDETQVRDSLGLTADARPNAFKLRPVEMAETLRGLPSVESADIDVSLPATLDIAVHERQPLLIWQTSAGAFLVDATGAVLAPAPPGSALPALADERSAAAGLGPGDHVDDVDLAAARLLLTIKPADVASASTSLSLHVNDADGWYIYSDQPIWRAVFGFYSANQLLPADRVPRQRQCLASLLAELHETPATIYLAVESDRCGTYREEPTPAAYSSQNVGRRAP